VIVLVTAVELPALTARRLTDNDHEHARRLRDNVARRTWRLERRDGPLHGCCYGLWVGRGEAADHARGHGWEVESS